MLVKTFLAGAILCGAIAGCAQLTVTKLPPGDDPSVKGQRVSLPKPYVQVTPQSDGSIQADIVYLPDPNRFYAVRSLSVFGSDTLEVATESGILKSVNWTGDSSAVLAQGVASAGNVAGTILQNEQKQQTDQSSKIADARKAVADAQLGLQQAQSDLALVLSTKSTDADVLKARIAANDAVFKLQGAQATLNRLLGFSAAGNPAGDKPGSSGVYGPALFAIEEELQVAAGSSESKDIVKLEPVEQKFTSTTRPASRQPSYEVARPTASKTPDDVKLFPDGVKGVSPDATGQMHLLIQSTVPLTALVRTKLQFRHDATAANLPPIAMVSPIGIDVDLTGMPSGSYTLHISWQVKKHDNNPDEEDGSTNISIAVQNPPVAPRQP